MGEQIEVHILKQGGTYTVWQEGVMLVPKLTWDQAMTAAHNLGGRILLHEEECTIDISERSARSSV